MAEQLAVNQWVVGSSPTPGATITIYQILGKLYIESTSSAVW